MPMYLPKFPLKLMKKTRDPNYKPYCSYGEHDYQIYRNRMYQYNIFGKSYYGVIKKCTKCHSAYYRVSKTISQVPIDLQKYYDFNQAHVGASNTSRT